MKATYIGHELASFRNDKGETVEYIKIVCAKHDPRRGLTAFDKAVSRNTAFPDGLQVGDILSLDFDEKGKLLALELA
jgi:hypothetical protein